MYIFIVLIFLMTFKEKLLCNSKFCKYKYYIKKYHKTSDEEKIFKNC